jgi:predicted nucleotidyltransferase
VAVVTDKNVIEQLKAFFAQQSSVELAILFGSVAQNRARPDSDLDIAVRLPQEMTQEQRIHLIEQLAMLFGRPVDLIDLHTAGEPLLGQIFKGVRIMGSDEIYARCLARHLIDAADFLPLQQRILKERREQWTSS